MLKPVINVLKNLNFTSALTPLLTRFQASKAGALAVAFALMAPVVVGAAGMGIDYARAYLVQQRLSHAIDAAALAAVASSSSQSQMEENVRRFFEANFPPEKLGVTFEPEVKILGSDVHVTGTAKYETAFLNVIGIDEVEVQAVTQVTREIQAIEVALVLDVTGSMASNNNIGTLREAATSFVNIVFSRSSNPDLVKVGLVPYSTAVNVGPYGLGYDMDGDAYGTSFVNNPDDVVFDQSRKNQWHGCVEASEEPWDTRDHDGPWDMYRFDCGGWGLCESYYDRFWNRDPNTWCNKAHVIPLSSDKEKLINHISTFQAQGSTLGNQGMVWGYRVLSPDPPFTEGSPWSAFTASRTAVMMTDGQNFINSYYSAYGPSSQHSVDDDDLNDKLLETCENMKEQGISIYTITFASGVNARTKDFYRACASTPDQYFDAPEQDDLIFVFETIGRELSNIHIIR